MIHGGLRREGPAGGGGLRLRAALRSCRGGTGGSAYAKPSLVTHRLICNTSPVSKAPNTRF